MDFEDTSSRSDKQRRSKTVANVAQVANLMVFGQKKSMDPMEEFWMNKLSVIEKQYDDHMIHLEKSLLENRIRSRFVTKQKERISLQKQEIETRSKENEKLMKKSKTLEKKLLLHKYEKESMKKKLINGESQRDKTMITLRDERYEKIRCQREISALKFKMGNLEKDKKMFLHEMSIKESERAREAEKTEALTKEKWNFIKKLSQVDTERRVQTTANITLCESIGQLLQVGKSQEDRLIKQKQDLQNILYGMELKRKAHDDVLRKLGISKKQIDDSKEQSVHATTKMEELNRQIKHWKEELTFKEVEKTDTLAEVRKLRNENSYLRCQMAKSREQLEKIQSEMVALENQKRKTEVELHTTKEHGKSIYNLMCRNTILRDKLAEKIAKSGSNVNDMPIARKSAAGSIRENTNDVASYKKKLWDLERQKGEIERKLNESKRKENMYQVKLSKYATLEEQILWTEKAMMKLDGAQKRTENFLKMTAEKFPKKMPFEKIVSDPSVMDRITKHKVLQARLEKQSARVEELKANTEKLLRYRDGRSTLTRNRPVLQPQWKLSYWMHKTSSRDKSSDLDDPLSTPSENLPLEERDYYKDYINYLDESIPNLKQQIFIMEKKQAKINANAALEEQRAKKKQQQDSLSDVGSDGHLVTVPEEQDDLDEETEYDEEEEEEDDDGEEDNDETDR